MAIFASIKTDVQFFLCKHATPRKEKSDDMEIRRFESRAAL